MVSAEIDPASGEPVEAYCNEYCSSSANDEEEASCGCGHPECDS